MGILFVSVLLLTLIQKNGQVNGIEVHNAGSLPKELFGSTTIFDGEDALFIIGRDMRTDYGYVAGYYLATGKVSVFGFGTFPGPRYATGGLGKNGVMYYIGGMYREVDFRDGIFKFTNQSPSPKKVGALYNKAMRYHHSSVVDDVGNFYLFGGLLEYPSDRMEDTSEITKYDSQSNTTTNMGNLPAAVQSSCAAWVGDSAFIFGGIIGTPIDFEFNRNITKYTPLTGAVSLVGQLPRGFANGVAVAVGQDIYVIRGYPPDSANPIFKFNADTYAVQEIEVTKFPKDLRDASAAYVSKLNRIYVVGGEVNMEATSQVLYIQLD